MVAVEIGSAVKPRFRSDQTSWLTAPVRTAIFGAATGSRPAGSDDADTFTNAMPVARARRVERVAGVVPPNTIVPAG